MLDHLSTHSNIRNCAVPGGVLPFYRDAPNQSGQLGKLSLKQRLLNVGPELVAGRNIFPETRQFEFAL